MLRALVLALTLEGGDGGSTEAGLSSLDPGLPPVLIRPSHQGLTQPPELFICPLRRKQSTDPGGTKNQEPGCQSRFKRSRTREPLKERVIQSAD